MSDYRPYLFVDSGAYSAFTRGQPIELQEWIGFCKRLKRKIPTAEYVNLDVIGNHDTGEQSYENWRKMREAGLDPLPVYHVNSHVRWLKKYLRLTDYVGLGAIADMSTHRRTWALDRVWTDYFIDPGTRVPKVKVHAMGVTSFPLMKRYPWFSIDSTSWLQAGMYGKIFVPHLKNGKWDYDRKPYQMNVSTKSPKLKEKGIHFQNLPPNQRAVLERYVTENGFKWGVSHFKDGEEVIDIPGLANNYYHRCFLNSLFYSRFVGTMPWPRPFGNHKPPGFFDAASTPLRQVASAGGRTRLFFSGEIPIENYMRQHPQDFTNCGIMLTFFTLRMSKTARPSRRLKGMRKNEPYQDGKRRKGLKVIA